MRHYVTVVTVCALDLVPGMLGRGCWEYHQGVAVCSVRSLSDGFVPYNVSWTGQF